MSYEHVFVTPSSPIPGLRSIKQNKKEANNPPQTAREETYIVVFYEGASCMSAGPAEKGKVGKSHHKMEQKLLD